MEGNVCLGEFRGCQIKCLMYPSPNRVHATFLPIIRKYILPGTTLFSDCWRTYQCLQFEGHDYLTVNHSYNFVDPDTGAKTKEIERTRREVRLKVPRFGHEAPFPWSPGRVPLKKEVLGV